MIDVWIVSTFWLLWLVLLSISVYKYLFEYLFLNLEYISKSEIAGSYRNSVFNLLKKHQIEIVFVRVCGIGKFLFTPKAHPLWVPIQCRDFFFIELIHNLLSPRISISDAYSLMKCSKVLISVSSFINWLAIKMIPTELLKPRKTIVPMTWIINLLGLQRIPYPGLVIFHYPINFKMTWSRILKYFYSDLLGILKQVLGK